MSSGGAVRLCDPQVAAGDTRACLPAVPAGCLFLLYMMVMSSAPALLNTVLAAAQQAMESGDLPAAAAAFEHPERIADRATAYFEGLGVYLIMPGFVKTPLTDHNDFEMPNLISADEAAREIIAGLRAGDFEIHFPKAFTRKLKLLRMLPYRLYFALIRKGTDLAMRLLGEQFVTGRTIEEALERARPQEARGYRYSYDMLGEAALTATANANQIMFLMLGAQVSS